MTLFSSEASSDFPKLWSFVGQIHIRVWNVLGGLRSKSHCSAHYLTLRPFPVSPPALPTNSTNHNCSHDQPQRFVSLSPHPLLNDVHPPRNFL